MTNGICAAYGSSLAVPHGFFTRRGGVSQPPFDSLNGSFGSVAPRDYSENIHENRRRAAYFLGFDAYYFPNQAHTNRCLIWPSPQAEKREHADAVVTQDRGLLLGLQTADCCPVLFHGTSPSGDIVGAAHAGWRGACHGVLEATISCMKDLGASAESIIVVLGPTIHQAHYSVGPDFWETIQNESSFSVGSFFAKTTDRGVCGTAPRETLFFDLPGYITHRLTLCGITTIENVGIDTYTHTEFFSRRRAVAEGEERFGGSISMIGLGSI